MIFSSMMSKAQGYVFKVATIDPERIQKRHLSHASVGNNELLAVDEQLSRNLSSRIESS